VKTFWPFAKRMLRYRRLIVIGIIGALISACSTVAGFGAMLWVFQSFFTDDPKSLPAMLEGMIESSSWLSSMDWSGFLGMLPTDPYHGFLILSGFVVVLTFIGATGQFIHQASAYTLALRSVMSIRKEAYHHLVHTPMHVSSVTSEADLLSRIIRDCSVLARGFTAVVGKATRDAMTGIVFLVAAFTLDALLAGIFVVGLVPVFLVIRKAGKTVRRATKRAMKAFGGMTAAVQESVQAKMVVKVHQAEGYERRRFNAVNKRAYAQEVRSRYARAFTTPAVETIAIVGVLVVAAIAGHVAFNDEARSPSDMFTVLAFLVAAGVTLKPIAKLNNDIQEASAAGGRIAEILDLPVEPTTRGQFKDSQAPVLARHGQSIAFEEVAFAYPGAEVQALAKVSLQINFGQNVAIVGPNGSGKTTLLNLVPRLHEPTFGKVLIDGHDIAQMDLHSLRKQMAVVTQHAVLFQGSIADNIAYGLRHISREQLIEAARQAYADVFVQELPDGYDTLLGESGAGLSGGQKQRLCLARAILRDPVILILDEATSQIDSDSEAKIQEALAVFRQGRTCLTIAHRLSTVVDADTIIVMADGGVVDQGTHRDLLSRCPLYQSLAQTQLVETDES